MTRLVVWFHEYCTDLDCDLVKIGRHRTSDIFIDNLKISNRHCSLYLVNGSPYIEDTSSNGTKLNGARLEKGQRRPVSSSIGNDMFQ
jgi:pSer/pThr/pTyr-binding forkhead associated (FHA) protein